MFKEKSVDNYSKVRLLDTFMEGHNGFIAGGCFKNIFTGSKIKDVDIFFKNNTDYTNAVEFYNKSSEYTPCYFNENVASYTHKASNIRIELCKKIFGDPENILNQFDFTITKCAYFKKIVKNQETNEDSLEDIQFAEDSEGSLEYTLLIHDDFFEHLFFHRLVTDNNIFYPASTFDRIIKYSRYGYYPCKETKLKVLQAINNLDPENILVSASLYDGVD